MKRFLNHDSYIIVVFVIALINWLLKINFLYWPLFGIFFMASLLFNIDRSKLIPWTVGGLIAFFQLQHYLFELIWIAIIFACMVYDVLSKRYYRSNGIIIAWFIWILTMFGSLFFSDAWEYTLFGIIRMVFIICIAYYFYNVQSNSKREMVVRSLIYVGLFVFVQIVVHFVRHYRLDFLEQMQMFSVGWGSFSEVSLLYMIIIPVVAYQLEIKPKSRWVLLTLFYIALLALFSTRGTYLAMLFLAIPFLMRTYNHHPKRTSLFRIFLVFIIGVLLFQLIVATPTKMLHVWYTRLTPTHLDELILNISTTLFRQNVFFGTGAYTAGFHLRFYFEGITHAPEFFANDWLETLVTTGIIGFIGFVLFLYHGFRSVRTNIAYHRYVLFIMFALLFHGVFMPAYYLTITLVVFSLLVSALKDNQMEEKLNIE